MRPLEAPGTASLKSVLVRDGSLSTFETRRGVGRTRTSHTAREQSQLVETRASSRTEDMYPVLLGLEFLRVEKDQGSRGFNLNLVIVVV